MIAKAVAGVASFEALYAACLLLLLLRACLRGISARKRREASRQVRPALHEALVEYLAGGPNLPRLKQLAKLHRSQFEDCLLEVAASVNGSARDLLWSLGMELSLVHDWCEQTRSRDPQTRCAALDRLAAASSFEGCRRVTGEIQLRALLDPAPEVRLAAARGLALSSDPADADRVFRWAVEQSQFARVLLTEALRPRAVALCETTVPEVLSGADESAVLAALEMVEAWGRAVPLPGLHRLIDSPSRAVCLRAMRVLPLVLPSTENRSALVRALSSEDREVALEAIACAAKLKSEEALPALRKYVEFGVPELAKAATTALESIPEPSLSPAKEVF